MMENGTKINYSLWRLIYPMNEELNKCTDKQLEIIDRLVSRDDTIREKALEEALEDIGMERDQFLPVGEKRINILRAFYEAYLQMKRPVLKYTKDWHANHNK